MIVNANALNLPIATILWYNSGMNKNDGRFIKGERRSPATEFKKGEHWRERKPFWEKVWLEKEYIENQRSANDIAMQFGITEAAILFWLRKHKIPARSMVDIRSIKHWGLPGEKNGMFGKRGSEVPNWKGGCTPDRQAFYSSLEWKAIRKQIVKRDENKCVKCSNTGRLDIHHIVSFSVKEKRLDPNNLILLCRKCHRWVHSKKNINNEFIREEVQE